MNSAARPRSINAPVATTTRAPCSASSPEAASKAARSSANPTPREKARKIARSRPTTSPRPSTIHWASTLTGSSNPDRPPRNDHPLRQTHPRTRLSESQNRFYKRPGHRRAFSFAGEGLPNSSAFNNVPPLSRHHATMDQFAAGQRWISEAEPELGLGTLVQVGDGRLQILFPLPAKCGFTLPTTHL